MATVAELAVMISADPSAFEREMKALGSKMKDIGALMTLGITAPLAGIGAAVVAAGREFDEAFDKIIIATGATGKELEGLKQSFRNVVSDVPTSFAKASEAISALAARTNLTGKALEDLTKAELELARMTGGNLAEQIRNTTRLFGDWGVATDQQTATLDKLFRAFQSGGGSVESLTQKLVQFGAPLRQMGFDLDEAIALIAKFEKEGVNMTTVLSSLRIALGNMAKAGVKDAGEALKILIDRIKAAGDTSEGARIAMEVFGRKAGPDMKAAILEGRFAIEEMIDKIKNGQSTIKSAGDQTKDFGERFTELKTKVMLAIEPLGERFFNAVNNLTPLLVRAIGALTSVIEWFIKLPQPVQNATIALLGIAAVAGPIVTAFGQIIESTSGLITSFSSTLPVIAKLGSALGGLPAIAGLAAAGVAAAVIAAEMKWSQAQARFKAGLDTSAKDVDIWGNKIKKMMRFDDPGLVEAINKPSKLVDGMVVDLKSTLTGAEPVIKGKATKLGAAVPAGFGDGLKSGGGGKRAAANFVDEFDQELVERLHASAAATKFILDEMIQGMEELYDTFRGIKQPAIEFVDAFEDIIEVQKRAATAAENLVPAEKELEGVFESAAEMIGNTEPYVRVTGAVQRLQSEFDKLSKELPRSWNIIIDALTGGATKAGVKIKGFASDLLNVFNDMPGKWGDAFRRTLSEVDRWINFIDAAIKLIQRIVGADQTGLGGIFSNLGKIFKKTTIDIQQSMEDIQTSSSGLHSVGGVLADLGTVFDQTGTKAQEAGTKVSDAMEDMAAKTQAGAQKALQGIGKFVADGLVMLGGFAMIVSGNQQGGISGALTGALGGAMLGAKVGSLIAPGIGTAIGAAIGAIGGFFAGIFGGGKSAAQKEQERLQLEQTKISVQQSAQAVINAAIQGFDAALSFFEHLDEFTAPRKRKFAQFWQTMTRLMNGFLELAKLWSTESLAKAKEAAEAIGPIANAISALPDAFTAINGHFGIAQSAIDRFFADFDKVMTAFFARADVWIEGVSKRAKKVALRLAPAVELIANFGTALTNIADIKEPSDEVFGIFDRVIDKILTHVVNLNLRFEKDVLKAMANFADRAGSALALWSTGVSTFKEMVDIKMPTEQDFANVFAGIEAVIKGMTEMADRLDTTALEKANAIANASLSIFASIKAGVEALSSLRDFTGILPEVFTAFYDGFNHAVELLQSMATRAAQFESVSKTFEGYIASGAASLSHAFTMLAQIMNAAGSFFPGGSPVIVPTGELGASAAQLAPASRTTPSASTTTINIGGLSFSSEDPRVQAFLNALADLLGPGTGLDSVIAQHG